MMRRALLSMRYSFATLTVEAGAPMVVPRIRLRIDPHCHFVVFFEKDGIA